MPLHPQSADFVNMIAAQNPPGWEELAPSSGRNAFSNLDALFGEKIGVESVDDFVLGETLEKVDPSARATGKGVRVRVYRSTSGALPGLVFFHGGGFVLGNIETHDALCRRIAVASGRCVISVEYRLSPEAQYPLPLEDCLEATKAVARFSQTLGVDPSRISVGGDSAGGNLAVGVALQLRDLRRLGEQTLALESILLVYPVVQPDFETASYQEFATGHGLTRRTMQWFWEQYVGKNPGPLPFARLLDADLTLLPKTLVLTAQYDVLRDEGRQLADQLSEAGVQTRTQEYDGMLHGFVHFCGFFETGVEAIEDIAQFLSAGTKA